MLSGRKITVRPFLGLIRLGVSLMPRSEHLILASFSGRLMAGHRLIVGYTADSALVLAETAFWLEIALQTFGVRSSDAH